MKVLHELNTLLRGGPPSMAVDIPDYSIPEAVMGEPHVTIEPCQALNLATLLPVREGGPPHNCKEILKEVYGSRPDWRDQPILDPDLVL